MNGVYDRIRQLRIANGLTQDELSLSKVAAIAQALHTTPKEMLFPSNDVSTLDT